MNIHRWGSCPLKAPKTNHNWTEEAPLSRPDPYPQPGLLDTGGV